MIFVMIIVKIYLTDLYILDMKFVLGFELFSKLEQAKHPIGITGLATCYFNGFHVDVNRVKAFELYKLSATLGYTGGMVNLAHCFARGHGTPQKEPNWESAVHWFESSASLM